MKERKGILFSETHLHFFENISYRRHLEIEFANKISGAIYRKYGVIIPSLDICNELKKPLKIFNCWFTYPCFKLAKKLGLPANRVSEEISEEMGNGGI